jgi:hypothetical protein
MATHIATRRKIAAANKAKVIELLYWNEMQYCTFQYECGLAYLRHYITHDQWGQDMLQRSKMFWAWWLNQWAMRDNDFVCQFTEGMAVNDDGVLQGWLSPGNLRIFYRYAHDPATLASDIYPNRVVLDESYNQMIASLIKDEVHA